MTAADRLFAFLWPLLRAEGITTQRELGAALGVSQPTVTAYVSGAVALPHGKVGTLVRVLRLDNAAELKLGRLVRAVAAERAALRAAG